MKKILFLMLMMFLCSNAYAYKFVIPVDEQGNELGTASNPITATLGSGSTNVGIGTSNPPAKLYVNGNVAINGTLNVLATGVNQFSGNTGIGVSPSYPLHYVGTSGYAVFGDTDSNSTQKTARIGVRNYTNSNNPFGLVVGVAGSSANDIYIGGGSGLVTAATGIHFFTAASSTTNTGTERMTILSGGNIGINTTTSSNRLFVNGDIRGTYKSSDNTAGATQTCSTSITAITVKDGIITSITCP